MAAHSSTLAWKIPWMEEPGKLQSMGLRRIRHDWETSLSLFTFMNWKRKWQLTPVFLPGESQRQEPGRLPCMGSHRVGHDWCDLAAAAAWYILSNIFTLALEHVFSITKVSSGCKNVIFFFLWIVDFLHSQVFPGSCVFLIWYQSRVGHNWATFTFSTFTIRLCSICPFLLFISAALPLGLIFINELIG